MVKKSCSMKYFLTFLGTFLFFLHVVSAGVYAESTYVLPYPSEMPGSKLYRVQQLMEIINKYWYFGDFGQFIYHKKYADKYLVQAKILFEYKQYLLGYASLQRSDFYFSQIFTDLKEAQQHGKDISTNRKVLSEAALKHIEELRKMQVVAPKKIKWVSEKAPVVNLEINNLIEKAIIQRTHFL